MPCGAENDRLALGDREFEQGPRGRVGTKVHHGLAAGERGGDIVANIDGRGNRQPHFGGGARDRLPHPPLRAVDHDLHSRSGSVELGQHLL